MQFDEERNLLRPSECVIVPHVASKRRVQLRIPAAQPITLAPNGFCPQY